MIRLYIISDCGLNSDKRRDALGFQYSSGNKETEIQNVSAFLKVDEKEGSRFLKISLRSTVNQ